MTFDRTNALIFLIGYLTTLLVLPGPLPMVSDSEARQTEAHWLWSGEDPKGELPGRNGVGHRPWGIGHTALLIPSDFISSRLTKGRNTTLAHRLTAYLTFPLLNGFCLLVCYQLLLLLMFSRRASILGVLTLLFGSTILWHFQNNQENPVQLTLTCLGIFCVLKWLEDSRSRWLAGAAAALGYNCLVRVPAAADLLAVFLFVPLVKSMSGRDEGQIPPIRTYASQAVSVGAPIFLLCAGIDRLYHWLRFGTIHGTYMHRFGEMVRQQHPWLTPAFPFENSFWDGFFGPLFSPGRSLFVYDPLILISLILAVVGWRAMNPKRRAVLVMTITLLVMQLSGYAKFTNWSGEASWGNRLTAVPVHLLALLAVPLLLESSPSKRLKSFACGLVILSCFIQFTSLIYPSWVETVQLVPKGEEDPLVDLRTGRKSLPFSQANHFYLGRRIVNIVADLSGHYADWNLPSARPEFANGIHSPVLVPLLPFTSLSPFARIVVKGTWWLCAALLSLCLYLLKKSADSRVLTPQLSA